MPRPDITEENPIREAIAADRPGIVSMLESIQRLKRGLIGYPMRAPEQATPEYVAELYGLIEENDGLILVYEMQDQVAGFIAGFITRDDDINAEDDFRDHALIADVYVRTNLRGLGIARALFSAFEQRMALAGARHVRIWAKAKNEGAMLAWQRLGFEPYETVFVKAIGPEVESAS
ncbi:MAG: GNAT family N-acetyltransferase [Hyphomicrobiaceae bacterium]|nr:GNAT family N-acetyltransferase [Hyphomicrobiaceae bacterium]MCC0024891.1 GNAT family N-acetyltransferase [Hyphomicrobiaceae bacterium]